MPSALTYIQLDYQSHRDAILARVKSRWGAVWNDFAPGSLGIVLVDLIAYSTATMAYTVNRIFGENFIPTMTLRESAVRLGALVNYKLHGPTSASLLCNATLTAVQTESVVLVKGTQVRPAGGGVTFELTQDYVIYPGYLTPQQDVFLLAPLASGTDTYQSSVQMYSGENYADVLDSTLDLTLYVSPGQCFVQYQGTIATVFTITRIGAAPSAVSNNRLFFDQVWTGSTGPTSLRFYDTRVNFSEGQTLTEQYVTPATSTPGFSLVLSQLPVLDNSLSILVGTQLWTYVNSLATSGTDDTVYTTQTLDSGQVGVIFGDGTFGALVPINTPVAVTYRVGGGPAGNVVAGSVSTGLTALTALTQTPVQVTIYNATAGEGGQAAETLEEARANIPAFVQTNDRAVTMADYVALATAYSDPLNGRIKFARVDVRLQNCLLEGNVVVLYAWAQGPTGGLVPANPALKATLLAYLQTKAVGTDYIMISDGTATPVPLSLRFQVQPGVAVNDVLPVVTNTINGIVNALKPGDTLYFSNLVSTLAGLTGVSTVTVATPVGDLAADDPTDTLTLPDSTYAYAVPITNNTGTLFTGQSPVTPLAAWSFYAFIDGVQALVEPDLTPGFARITAPTLNAWNFGPQASLPAVGATGAYFLVTDQIDTDDPDGTLYQYNGSAWIQVAAGTAARSTVDLRTGAVVLSATGTIGAFTIQLITATGYEGTRSVNVFAAYTGSDLSQTKRREVRAAIRSLFDGLQVGASVYGSPTSGVDASLANITDVIRSVDTVSGVSRVALDTPSNTVARVDAVDTELLVLGICILNGESD